MDEKIYKVRTPWFRPYSEVRVLLQVLQSVPRKSVKNMIAAIERQTGTPQNPVDWSDPDRWIPERLQGDNAQLAQRIWNESNHTVHPRYIEGARYLIDIYKLLQPDSAGKYLLTERGKHFLENEPEMVREIDDLEGILQLLTVLATKNQAKSSDLVPEWGDFLRVHSKFGTEGTIKDTLRRRLVGLVERGFVLRTGNSYQISPEGLAYITSIPYTGRTKGPQKANPTREVLLAVEAFNTNKREELRQQLRVMNPYRFEQLVGDLLEAMGYEDVTVTKASGDYGVDVVATVQFGITTITEVIQVKRYQNTIQRHILDQLRGALPYHKALRGTIITLSRFSSGCIEAALYPGAAPIGLIDGEKLLDLLFKHDIGLKKRSLDLYELDEEYLTTPDDLGEAQQVLNEELD